MKDIGSLALERNKPASGNPYIHLLYIEASSLTEPNGKEAFRLCSTVEDVSFGTFSDSTPIVWRAYPFRIGEVREEGEGSLPSVQVTLPNIGEEVLEVLFQRDFLDNEKVELHVVNKATLLDPKAKITVAGRMGDVQVDERAVAFTIGSEDLYSRQLPAVTVTEDGCEHVYGGELCQFPIETLDPGQALLGPCVKTLAACRLRRARAVSEGYTPLLWPKQYGGFPGVLS